MAEQVTYKFEKSLVGGQYKFKYIGETVTGVADDTPKWTIYKFTWIIEADNSISLSEIQSLNGKAWTDRDTLAW